MEHTMAFSLKVSQENIGKSVISTTGSSLNFPFHEPVIVTISSNSITENESVALGLKTDENQTLTVYLPLNKKDGTENLRTKNILTDIAWACGLDNLEETTGSYTVYVDKDTTEERQGRILGGLTGKRVGLIVGNWAYFSPKYNRINKAPEINGVFDADKKLLAKDFADGKDVTDVQTFKEFCERSQQAEESYIKEAGASKQKGDNFSLGNSLNQSDLVQGVGNDEQIPF